MEWLVGLATSVLGFALQALALYLAPVVLVQPLIVAELVFALPLAARLRGVRLGRREWTGIVAVAGGLALFMLTTHPTGERTDLPLTSWAVMVGSVAIVVAVLVAVGEALVHRPMPRASALAAAAGVCFGLLSVDTKVVTKQFQTDGLAALGHFQPYLMAVAALTGLLLSQTAFKIAPLSVSLPMIDLGEPLIGSLLAVTVFGEALGRGSAVVPGVAVAAVAIAGGVALLDTSPVVRNAQREIVQESDDNLRPCPPDGRPLEA